MMCFTDATANVVSITDADRQALPGDSRLQILRCIAVCVVASECLVHRSTLLAQSSHRSLTIALQQRPEARNPLGVSDGFRKSYGVEVNGLAHR